MGLLQELPTQAEFDAILGRLVGDPAQGTGLAGAQRLLETLDAPGLAGSAAAGLARSSPSSGSAQGAVKLDGPLGHIGIAVEVVPPDPEALLGPLRERFEELQRLAGDDLTALVRQGIDALRELTDLLPADTRDLFAAVATGLERLNSELVAGGFGDLRAWSEGIRALLAEVAPLLAGGAGTVQERLIAFLRAKVEELVGDLLPGLRNPAQDAAAGLDAAITADRLAALNSLAAELTGHLKTAKAKVDAGDVADTAALDAAVAAFTALTAAVTDLVADLEAALAAPGATPKALAELLQGRFDALAGAEIVQLGNIRERVAAAIGSAEEAVRSLDLPGVRARVEALFADLQGVIERAGLQEIPQHLQALTERIEALARTVEGALLEAMATLRAALSQVRDAVRAAAGALGTFDGQGRFEFTVVADVLAFLEGVAATFRDDVRPALDGLKASVEGTLQQIAAALGTVTTELEGVKAELQGTLEEVTKALEALDVPAGLAEVRDRLDAMIAELGDVDFDLVVDPVIAQIDELRDALAEIDVSAMSEITVGALKVSVEVVVDIDFTGSITGALMEQIDALLEVPRTALAQIEAQVEGALARVADLDPDVILAPLDAVFEPVRRQLDRISVDALLEPLDRWHADVEREVARLSPAALLAPLVEAFDTLEAAVTAVQPAAVMEPVETVLEAARARVRGVDATALARQLTEPLEQARAALDALAPEALLAPLVSTFDEVERAFDDLLPSKLLEPALAAFDSLTAPLEGLEPAHVALVGAAFAPLQGLPAAVSAEGGFATIKTSLGRAATLAEQADLGGLLAGLRAPHGALRLSVEASGPGGASLKGRVELMDPLRSDDLTGAVARLGELRLTLATAAAAQPPAELVARSKAVGELLERLVPDWLGPDMTVASIRAAFRAANPLNVAAELDALHAEVKAQLQALDPTVIQDGIRETFETLKDAVLAIDAEAIADALEAILALAGDALDALDLGLVTRELEGLADDAQAVVAALDPRAAIGGLDAIKAEVEEAVAALKPSEVLAGLDATFLAAKNAVLVLDPAALKPPLEDLIRAVQAVVEQVDVGVVLQPLLTRLTELRDELEASLDKTETAFGRMLQAIPV